MPGSRRKKGPKSDLHVMINPLVIEYFESLRPLHGREYSEFVEEKLLELVSPLAPELVLKMEIEKANDYLKELETSLIEVNLLKSLDNDKRKAESEIKKLQDEDEIKLQAHRLKMFEKYKPTLEFQRKNHITHDWSKIQEDFRFKTKTETQDFICEMMN